MRPPNGKRRILGVVRLSLSHDETDDDSVDRQKDIIEMYAKSHYGTVVAWAIDNGVSGEKNPFDRADLRTWLTDEAASKYDLIVAWKVDRLGRTVRGVLELDDWLQERDKGLAITEAQIDTTTPPGRMMLTQLAGMAEMELAQIKSRVRRWHEYARQHGRPTGNLPSWIYREEDGTYRMDQDRAAVLRRIVNARLDGDSFPRIIEQLENDGVKTLSGNDHWSIHNLSELMRSPALAGCRYERPGRSSIRGRRLVSDTDGVPIRFFPPIISLDEWRRLNSNRQGPRKSKSLKYNVLGRKLIRCGECNGIYTVCPVSRKKAGQKDSTEPELFYRHIQGYKNYSNCKSRTSIPYRVIDELLEAHFMDKRGDSLRVERVEIPASDKQEEIEQLKYVIEGVRQEWNHGLYEGDMDAYISRLKGLTNQLKEAEFEHDPSPRVEWRKLDTTWREWWNEASVEERRQGLVDIRVSVKIWSQDEQPVIQPNWILVPLPAHAHTGVNRWAAIYLGDGSDEPTKDPT
ncbi:recombinase family protein [Haloglycomyces albus]|uniref:recombinase family protein n=1 Tax=Haloglycomyces albus TaxID=526067 RepID=UPI00046CBF00|nr:recombinase family protein [Haloglycomyces albus]